MEIENNSAYTIICVKRKLNEEDNNNDDRYNSFKKLRHVGSFAEKRDDKTSKQLLRQVGIAEPNTKRLKVSDLTEEQFKSYVEKYEDKLEATGDEKLQSDANDSISKDKDDEKNSVNPNSSDYNDHEKTLQPNSSGNQITCNGMVMEESSSSKSTDYVYDYYILMDNMFVDDENADDLSGDNEHIYDDEADENDENYIYNDYPDEDEVFDEDGSSHSSNDSDDDGYHYKEFDEDEFGGIGSDESFCDDFLNKLSMANKYESDEDYDDID